MFICLLAEVQRKPVALGVRARVGGKEGVFMLGQARGRQTPLSKE